MMNCLFYNDEPLASTPPPPPPSPLPTASANPPEFLIIEPIDCETDGRYEKIIEELTPFQIEIRVSKFNDIHHRDIFGGAIRVENTGIVCDNANFDHCSSIEAGGAVYISNNNDIQKDIRLENMEFKNCDADLFNDIITVKKCSFDGNSARGTEENGKNFGGSAIFLSARVGSILRCTFVRNHGQIYFKLYSNVKMAKF